MAATITFVDAAYVQKDQVNITDQDGNNLGSLSHGDVATINPGIAYFLEYHPKGLFDLILDNITNLTTLKNIILWFSDKDNLTGFLAFLILCVMVGLAWGRK